MINGVMHIVAAVLFAVISLNDGVNVIWMTIAGIYLLTGIINLVIHAVKVKKIQKAAQKAEQKAEQNAEQNDVQKALPKTAQNETNVGG